ncbi:MAG: hypothetical protein J5I90_10805 [Caldilineales bacterium]|nr:hypothetical protein [Caldilineales bacterium]
MKTMIVETDVQANGRVHLDIETDLPPGKVELVVVMQPIEATSPPYPSLEGSWQSLFPEDFDLDAVLREVRHSWEAEWQDVE